MSATEFLQNLGTGQNLDPTTAALSEVLTFGPGGYRVTVINVNDSIQNDGPSLYQSIDGLPAAFRYLVLSFWSTVDYTDPSVQWVGLSSTSSGTVFTTWNLSIQSANKISFSNYLPDGITPVGAVVWTITAPLEAVNHFVISIDAVGQAYQCFVNGEACTVFDSSGTASGDMTNAVDATTVVQVAGSVNGGLVPTNFPLTEFWLGDTAAFFDLTNPANLAKFYGGVETPVDLGTTGQIPFGVAPPLYFTVRGSGPVSAVPGGFLICGNDWTITQPVTKLYGFDHLIGRDVVGLADGVPLDPITVAADGSVTLPFAASYVTLGLAFTVQMQTPYIDTGNPTAQGRRKNITAVTVRVDASGAPFSGTNQPDGGSFTPTQVGPAWSNMQPSVTQDPEQFPGTYLSPAGETVTLLFSGDFRANLQPGWDERGQVAVEQTLPVPLSITAVVPELLQGDTAEQTYAQQQGGGGQGDDSRGPGLWMLTSRGRR